MMIDWNKYQKQIGATLGELMKLSPALKFLPLWLPLSVRHRC